QLQTATRLICGGVRRSAFARLTARGSSPMSTTRSLSTRKAASRRCVLSHSRGTLLHESGTTGHLELDLEGRKHMAMQQQGGDFYSTSGQMTSAGKYSDTLAALPTDINDLIRIVQGLLIHEYMAGAYGLTIPEERKAESHIRQFERMIERTLEID